MRFVLKAGGSLEIEGEGDHLGSSAVEAFGELQQRGIDEVVALVDEDVAQAEAEAELRDELEVGEIDVAACRHLDIAVEDFCAQGHVLAGGEVEGGSYADREIGAEIVVARRGNLQGDGYGKVSGLEVLGGVASAELFVEDDVLLSEVDGGLQTQAKGLVEPQLSEDAYDKSWLVVVDIGVPLFARDGIDVTVIGQFQVHHIHSHEEAIVQKAVIQIRAVLDTGLLGCYEAAGKEQTEDER